MINSKRQKGFTMVEVLVAVVILAIGLLGISRAQLTGFKSNSETMVRTQAVTIIYMMADRMRSNMAETSLGSLSVYAVLDPSTASAISGCGTPPSGCSKTSMAENDLNEWWAKVSELPLGTGSITFNNGYTIIIQWDSDRSGVITAADSTVRVEVKLQ